MDTNESSARAPAENARASRSEQVPERVDVAVIGGGQAGLVMGYFLGRQGRSFVILEAGASIGEAWRTRWNSLVLFTSRRFSGLAGRPFPGDPEGYATRDEVLAYLEQYAATFDLPVQLETPVRRLSPAAGGFDLELDDGLIKADQVVVATGPFQVPRIPAVADQLASEVFQIHSTGYMEPSDVPAGTVIVVGGGNTGYQIAEELSATRQVYLAIGSRQTPLPQRLLGRDLFWWLTKVGFFNKTVDSRIGQRLQQREDTLIGSSPKKIRRVGVELKPRLTGASGRLVNFADGSTLEVDAVIWATGYRSDYSWIDAPVVDSDGRVKHRRGVTDVPGLYFLGMPWQYTRGSALIGWIKSDAQFIGEQIEASAKARPREREPHEHQTLGTSGGG
jgi:putative flavoprotein involved in K+ transport